MGEMKRRALIRPGDPAPDFDVELISPEGRARRADYHGRAPLLLVLLRTVQCPFCRRHLAALKAAAGALLALGVETLAVTTTGFKVARLYARYRPPGLPLASDPALATHRAYGVPIYRVATDRPTRWPETVNPADLATLELNPGDEITRPMPIREAVALLDRIDGFESMEADEPGPYDDVSPLVSYFLIDRQGTVRWNHVVALDDPADYAQHPSNEQLLSAARAGVL
jgi:peroxiredoxin